MIVALVRFLSVAIVLQTMLKRMGTLSKLSLYIFGTKEKPYHMSRKRSYEYINEQFDPFGDPFEGQNESHNSV